MLHEFLDANRKEVIERCRERVARRPAPHPTPQEVEHGVRLFLAELIETLRTRREPGAPEGDKVLRTSRRLESSRVTAAWARRKFSQGPRSGSTVSCALNA